MRPAMYGVRGGAVVISTDIDGQEGPDLIIDEHNTCTLLGITLNALRVEGDAEKMDAAAKTCVAMLGRGRFR